MCQGHSNRPVVPGKTQCQSCIDRKATRALLNNSNGMCQGHPNSPVVPGKTKCQLCREVAKDIQLLNNSNGMCRNHPKNPVKPDTTLCPICLCNKKKNSDYRIATDVNYKLSRNLRNRLYQALRRQLAGKKVSAVGDLGCSVPELMEYLEVRFKPGMTWDNYGAWHIDHIRPLVAFNLTDADQQKAACHFSNLQPLWAEDNLSKGSQT